jgi:type III pantothenate kinase
MLLLVDNSNRTTKLALGDGNGVVSGSLRRCPSAGLTVESLRAAIGELAAGQGIQALCWASVTREGPVVLRECASMLQVPDFELSAGTCGLDLTSYPEPSTIGPDRLANALAASVRFPGQTAIAIDAGTAITFNAVRSARGSRPVFLGGAIAPGLGLFARWLAGQTARLPEIPFPEAGEPPPTPIGKSTTEALRAAAWHGATGMLKEILARQSEALGGAPALVLTGSDASVVAAMLDSSIPADPILTLDGIRRAYLLQFPS